MVAPYIRKNHDEFNSRLDGRLSNYKTSVEFHEFTKDIMFGRTVISHTCLFEDDLDRLKALVKKYAGYYYITYGFVVVIF